MSNRYMNQYKYSFEKGVTYLYFNIAIGASGAPTLNKAGSKGIASVVRNSAGNYTITLQDAYYGFLDFTSREILASGAPVVASGPIIRSQAVTNSAAPTLVIQYFDAATSATATDPDNGATLIGTITVKNHSSIY